MNSEVINELKSRYNLSPNKIYNYAKGEVESKNVQESFVGNDYKKPFFEREKVPQGNQFVQRFRGFFEDVAKQKTAKNQLDTIVKDIKENG